MNTYNSDYKMLLEKIGRKNGKKTDEQARIELLKEFGAYEILYGRDNMLNEEHTWNTEDNEDLEELKFIMGRLRYVIPGLMKTLLKKGAKGIVKLCVRAAKYAIKTGKENPEVCKNLFYSLLFFCVGYCGNAIKDAYNNNPSIPNTQIEYREVNGRDTLVVKNTSDNTITVVQQPQADEAPVVKEIKKSDDNSAVTEWTKKMESEGRTVVVKPSSDYNLDVYALPIHPLQPGEKKIDITSPSDEIIVAIAETEVFVDHLYDTANRNKKLTMKDIQNPKADITIGYGRAVKSIAERKKLFGKTITKELGLQWYKEDIAERVPVVNNKIKLLPYYNKVNISLGVYDQIFSTVYNMGAGNAFGNAKRPMSEWWRRMTGIRIEGNGKFVQQDMDYALAKINTQNTGNANQGGLKIRRRAEYWIAKQPYGTIKPSIYHLKNVE